MKDTETNQKIYERLLLNACDCSTFAVKTGEKCPEKATRRVDGYDLCEKCYKALENR